MKKITMFLCAMLFAFSVLLSGCSSSDGETNEKSIEEKSESAENISDESGKYTIDTSMKTDDLSSIKVKYTQADKDVEYNASDAVYINLSDDGSEISGQGAVTKGHEVTITQAGTYVLSGKLSDGQIEVDAAKLDDVTLVFDGVDITNENASAVYVKQAEKVFILLAEGSKNTIRDGEDYKKDKDGAPDAALYSEDDLTIKGKGSLVVEGNFNHAVHTKDELVITGGVLDIMAVEDGLKGKDSVSILGGDVSIVSDGDGIISNNDKDDDKGFVSIDGGNIAVQAGASGIEGRTGILISKGTLNMDVSGDALHSNGSILIEGGTMMLSDEDDGMHADNAVDILGGNISILNSFEGLEGAYITISGGNISIVSEDDGINAAGGSDDGSKKKDKFSSAGRYFILIDGGNLTIDVADGDGIDSNGTIEIAGGNIKVVGSQRPTEPVLDTNGGAVVYSGGAFSGGTNMMMLSLPTKATHTMVAILFTETDDKYMDATLKDSDDNVILTADYDYTYPCIIFASQELITGQKYFVEFGDGSEFDFEASGGLMTVNEKGEDIKFTYEKSDRGMRSGSDKNK